jgi:hypothetical protein
VGVGGEARAGDEKGIRVTSWVQFQDSRLYAWAIHRLPPAVRQIGAGCEKGVFQEQSRRSRIIGSQ